MNKITPQRAKEIIDNNDDVIILDVRNQDEYDTGHLRDAMLIPVDELEDRAEFEIEDYDAKILVYCHSGRRAATAAALLENMGYTDVSSFGGVEDWPYDLV